MFSMRKALRGTRYWDKVFIVKFSSDLSSAGFSNIVIKLPHNLVGLENSEIPLQNFLDRERNYPSIIFVAKNEATSETIKMLFVNISPTAFFLDDTFPSGHSQGAELFVQSPDPARTYSLFHFFYEYLQKDSSSLQFFMWLVGWMLSLLFIVAELLYFVGARKTIFQSSGQFGIFIDIIGMMIAIALQYRYFTTPQGLYVKERKSVIGNYVNMAIKGQLRDNPVVNIVVSVITSVITAALLKLLGLI